MSEFNGATLMITGGQDIHKSAEQDDIEFIIASCENDQRLLYCIKNDDLEENCDFCWIGSAQAHNQF